MLFVPSLVASLVAANQKNRHTTGVKGEEDTPGITSKLHPQFLHVGERQILKRIDVGSTELRPALSQQVCMGDYLIPQLDFQPGEPATNSSSSCTSHSIGNSYSIRGMYSIYGMMSSGKMGTAC